MKDRRELFRVDVEGKRGRASVVPVGGLLIKKGLDMQVFARFGRNNDRGELTEWVLFPNRLKWLLPLAP